MSGLSEKRLLLWRGELPYFYCPTSDEAAFLRAIQTPPRRRRNSHRFQAKQKLELPTEHTPSSRGRLFQHRLREELRPEKDNATTSNKRPGTPGQMDRHFC